MRVLLLKPPVQANQVYNVIPPIGLGYLATALMRDGHEVLLFDAINNGWNFEATLKHIINAGPDIVGYQTFSYDVGMVRRISERLKSTQSPTPIIQVVGGAHISGMGAKALQHFPHVDYALAGEGERTFAQLVNLIEKEPASLSDQIKSIPGLIYRGMDQADFIPPRFAENLDELSFPAWELHPPTKYPFAPQGAIFRQRPFAPIVITRGCPFPCTFCASHSNSGKKLRTRSIEHVLEEMRALEQGWGVREFHILDDNFSLNRDYFMRWCNAVTENFPGISWCAPNGMRLDTLDPEMVRAMKAAGCYYVSVGIESGSDRILKHMRKGFTVDDIRERVSMIRSEGLDVNGFFMLGYPTETMEDMEATIQLSTELDLSRAAYFNFLPLPGTTIFDEHYPNGLENGIWDSFFQYNAPYAPPGITPKDVKSL